MVGTAHQCLEDLGITNRVIVQLSVENLFDKKSNACLIQHGRKVINYREITQHQREHFANTADNCLGQDLPDHLLRAINSALHLDTIWSNIIIEKC